MRSSNDGKLGTLLLCDAGCERGEEQLKDHCPACCFDMSTAGGLAWDAVSTWGLGEEEIPGRQLRPTVGVTPGESCFESGGNFGEEEIPGRQLRPTVGVTPGESCFESVGDSGSASSCGSDLPS